MNNASPHHLKKRVLILCTGNSCRSQMAEALWRHAAGDRYEVASAGTVPKNVHRLTLRVLEELGISTAGLRSKHLSELDPSSFDLIVTVCDSARETCPVLPGQARREHWPFEDPAAARGSEQEILSFFRRTRDAIHQRIREFVASEGSGQDKQARS